MALGVIVHCWDSGLRHAKESWRKKRGKEREWICLYQVGKKKTQLSTSAENSTADPENIFLPPKENESAFQKAYKTFNLPNNDSSLGIKEFLLLRKEETIFIFRNELETYKALKVSKWVHCIYSKATDAGKMIKNVEFKTPNNDVLQGTNLARLYDYMSEKIVKESEDFEDRDSGWTLDEILRLEVRTNRYSPFRGSSSFIEVPKQITETKAIINVINKRTLSVSCGLFSQLFTPTPATPTKRQVMSPT
ncbi:c2H2-type domain-containing protein [Trichonephila clavipes]|uniref:C2H2-type domain-containing protein n=1 Tax=Trichonephila clavipes TaxID=2585209 RepID=A0A8X6WJP2_TRICX|nr:c2H2-type domain-containing protein [Trichonephila clavipes]